VSLVTFDLRRLFRTHFPFHAQMLERFHSDVRADNNDLHHVYRALDVLAADKDDLETLLFLHGRDLFSRHVDVLPYDLTALVD